MKILTILTADKETLNAKKAERKANSLKRNQERLIDGLEDKRDDLLSKKDELLAVTMETVEESWNEQFQNCIVELAMLDKKIEIAKATMTEYFTDAKASS